MSSYIRFEILLFLRSLEAGIVMVLVYRVLSLPGNLLFRNRKWKNTVDLLYWLTAGILLFMAAFQSNYGRLRNFMLAGVAFGGIFANIVLNRLLFLVKRCNILWYKHTKRRLWCNRRGRRFEKVKKEKE